MIQHAIEKAAVLIEALPFLQQFRGETVVVKFGGSLLEEEENYAALLRDVAFMEILGLRPVLVHGGGKAITARMQEEGVQSEFRNGLRVTDAQTVAIVDDVLNHVVNPRIREVLDRFQAPSIGLRGQELFEVRKHQVEQEDGSMMDWGFVGDVLGVQTRAVTEALAQGLVPVVTPLGRDEAGQLYNINADEAAGALARELQARKLVFLSDVPGILRDPSDAASLISSLGLSEMEELIEEGVIGGGMLPKLSGAVKALKAGVRKVHIIDASLTHSLLLELFTEEGVGTEILSEAL